MRRRPAQAAAGSVKWGTIERATQPDERLTKLGHAAEKGRAEHRELNQQLIKARRRLYGVEWGA